MKAAGFRRFLFAGVLFTLVGSLIILQIFRIQTSAAHAKIMADNSDLYAEVSKTLEPERGAILDRWGKMLAGNKLVYEVGVDMQKLVNPEGIASALSSITGTNYNRSRELLSLAQQDNLRYIPLARNVEPAKIDEIIAVRKHFQEEGINALKGLMWTPHLQRTYPENALGSNVTGFYTFLDLEGGRGHFGVEGFYNGPLTGTRQLLRIPQDPYQAKVQPTENAGATLVLTIDREIQAAMERIADEAVKKTGARSATILVYDPKTGEFLAMASTPHFNPNQYWDYDKVFDRNETYNRAVGATYEPGSVFKVLTMAAAIDAKVVTPDTPFLDTGSIEVGGYRIYNWNRAAWGPQTMTTCMQHSLNVCLTWVAQQLNTTRFYDYIKAFGIGRRTNIDLDGEVNWPLTLPGDSNWYQVNLATNSFGQGVAVTPVQMVMAIGSVANNGSMMAPHVLKTKVEKGIQYDTQIQAVGSPITAQTARTVTDMLAISLEKEASTALVPGYRVAGKTGTGEIPGPYGYLSNTSNASFVGWGPADDPKFLIYVWLERPTSSPWGSVVAAPVFSEAFRTVATLTNLPPDQARKQLFGK